MAVTLSCILSAIIIVTKNNYHGKIYVNSNYGNITIYRDEYAIPHIFGENKKAAYFGIGYL